MQTGSTRLSMGSKAAGLPPMPIAREPGASRSDRRTSGIASDELLQIKPKLQMIISTGFSLFSAAITLRAKSLEMMNVPARARMNFATMDVARQ
jgi:hypothetical protein